MPAPKPELRCEMCHTRIERKPGPGRSPKFCAKCRKAHGKAYMKYKQRAYRAEGRYSYP